MMISIKAFGSPNLVPLATITEPTVDAGFSPYSTYKDTLNRRQTMIATNVTPSDMCTQYATEEGLLIFKLDRPTQLEFVNMVFESDTEGVPYAQDTSYSRNGCSTAGGATRGIISNNYSRGMKLYAGNAPDISSATLIYTEDQDAESIYCSASDLRSHSADKWRRVFKSGFEAEVPADLGAVEYVIFHKPEGVRSRPCHIGIFSNNTNNNPEFATALETS